METPERQKRRRHVGLLVEANARKLILDLCRTTRPTWRCNQVASSALFDLRVKLQLWIIEDVKKSDNSSLFEPKWTLGAQSSAGEVTALIHRRAFESYIRDQFHNLRPSVRTIRIPEALLFFYEDRLMRRIIQAVHSHGSRGRTFEDI
jgi:hypothetical protein